MRKEGNPQNLAKPSDRRAAQIKNQMPISQFFWIGRTHRAKATSTKRARAQFQLLGEMDAHWDEMVSLIDELASREKSGA